MHRAAWPGLGILPTLALFLVLTPACEQATGPAESGLQLWFAPMEATCSQTNNGSGNVPEAVDTLAVVLHPEGLPPSTHRKSRKSVNNSGFWEISGLLATAKLDVEVHGCDADGKVIYSGRSNGAAVVDQKATSTHVFLAPVAQLTCTGAVDAKANDGQGHLYQPTSLSRVAELDGGDALVTGGLSTWSSAEATGHAGVGTALYNHQAGFFGKGPDMQGKRALHHAHGLDSRHVLVAGGFSSLDLYNTDVFGGALLAPGVLKDAHSTPAVELIDIGDGTTPASAKAAAVDVGTGNRYLSSSIDLGSELLFVGGVSDDAKPSGTLTRVGGLADIVAGGKGTSESFEMLSPRAGPVLMAFADGTVVIWGGAQSGASDMGELLVSGSTKTTKLTVTGAKALLDDANLATYGAAAALLRQSGDKLWFVVAGGQPFAQPRRADGALAYVVEVDKAGTAMVKTLALSTGTLRAGVGTAATRLSSGQVLFAGGLLAISKNAGTCGDQDECIINDVQLLEAPADLAGDAVTLNAAMPAGQLAGPGFGVSAASLPWGALLAGGQTTVIDLKATGDVALDPTARIVMGAPAAEQHAAICGK